MDYKKYEAFKTDTICSVDGCNSRAEYEVVLYDYYQHNSETFYEQDFTCPFLCQKHMDENEAKAKGERRPRGVVYYPYTNKHAAQGYSKYNPLKEVYPQLFDSGEIENNKKIQVDLNEINNELIQYLSKHPEFMREMNPRKFEILIAEILKDKGYEITLTPSSRDGGKDIVAVYNSPFGHQMFIVECKRYNEQNKVGAEIVRGLYGVQMAGNYNQGIIATTSTFTQGAIDFVKPLKFQLELKDFEDIKEWIKNYGK
ncbi:MAG: restriction endonuclease [Bacteroidales bacterium]|jgi:restriction endonuclease Mrr